MILHDFAVAAGTLAEPVNTDYKCYYYSMYHSLFLQLTSF